MPARSKKPSPKRRSKTKAELTKPFDKKVWAKAVKIAERYTYMLRPEDGEYYGKTLEMPLVMADGPTRVACMEQVMEATTAVVADMLDNGERPPAPASDEKRSAQLNVRLTADEKFRIEEAARRAGFRGVSDFVRAAALDKAG